MNFIFLSALLSQHNSLRTSTAIAVNAINAQGVMLTSCLQDVLEHVREIAIHGIRHGAAVALASAQVCSGYELHHLPRGFPLTSDRSIHAALVEDFSDEANTIAFNSSAVEIIEKVFSGP
jgi:uridine phosphorylase